MLALGICALVWVYRDAERRGKFGLLIAFLVLITLPLGLLLWLAARPSQMILRVAPFKEAIDCPKCGVQIKAGKTACLNCGYQNQEVIQAT